jgi:hypothetical protein
MPLQPVTLEVEKNDSRRADFFRPQWHLPKQARLPWGGLASASGLEVFSIAQNFPSLVRHRRFLAALGARLQLLGKSKFCFASVKCRCLLEARPWNMGDVSEKCCSLPNNCGSHQRLVTPGISKTGRFMRVQFIRK